jgi:glyoxylase-like metal-dependent hydrolase (beta-lactamase superfamily II)
MAGFVAPHKRARPMPAASGARSDAPATVNAPSPPLLDYPYAAPPPPGGAIEVAQGLWWIRMPLPFALDHINLWLAHDEDGAWTAIDSGYGSEATRALWTQHFAGTLRGAPLRSVVATHYHPDHLGNAAWLASRFGAPVHMTQAEFLTAHAILDQRATHALADTCALFLAHGLEREHVDALAARGNAYARGVQAAPRTIERMIAGDTLRFGGGEWTVIAGHGHSPEHASLHAAASRTLISGDMLLPRISTNVSVWPADPDGDPLGRFLASLAAFERLPGDTLVLPSHGLPFRGIAARVAELRAHHAARLAELVQALADAGRPLSAGELVPVLFRRPLDLQQRFFATGEAIAHLNHLWHAGRATRRVAEGGTITFGA